MDLDGKNRPLGSLEGRVQGRQQRHAMTKYLVIGLVRIMGIAIMTVGFAILLNDFMQLSEILGYFLVFMGAIEFIVMPIMLARMWKTPDDKNNAGIEDQ